MDFTRVLVVTTDNKISSQITAILPSDLFDVVVYTDYNEARRKISQSYYEIIIIDSLDGSKTDFAIDISEVNSTILLLVNAQLFDQISYKVEAYGVLTLTKPFDAFYFYNMIKVSLAVQAKIKKLSFQNIKLKEKMDEIRLVNRAKMLLMQHQNLSEADSHRYIEKKAMDQCKKRTDIAKEIISTWE